MDIKNEKVIYILMIITSVFGAGAFIAGKFSVNEFPTFTLTFLRFIIASVIIFIIMILSEKNWKPKLKDLPLFMLLGITGMFGYHILFFTALRYTSAINSSLIASTNPLITTILSAIFLGDKLNIKKIGAILLSLIGVLLAITGGDIASIARVGFNIGDLLMIAAVFCWVIYSIISKKASVKYSPIVLLSYSFLSCTLFLIPFVILEKPLSIMKNTTANGWLSIIYMAVFPSVIGYLIQQISVKQIGPRRTAAFLNLMPAFSIVLSIMLLGEAVNILKIFSSILIISGVYITTKLKS